MHRIALGEKNAGTDISMRVRSIRAESELQKLETLNTQARDLEQTIAGNVTEILEA